jgi:FtsZ-interacting cell division protein ZipA
MELELRLTILAIGLVIIAFIYLWGIRHRIKEIWEERRQRRPVRTHTDPSMTMEAGTTHSAGEEQPKSEPEPEPDRTLANKTDALINTDRESRVAGRPENSFVSEVDRGGENHGDNDSDNDSDNNHVDADVDSDDEEHPNILVLVLAPRETPFQGTTILNAAQELELKLNNKGTWSYCPDDDDADSAAVFPVGHLKEPGNFDMKTINTMATPGLVLFAQLPGPLEALVAVDRMIGLAGQLAEKLGGSVRDDHGHKMTPQLISHLRTQAAEYDRRQRLRHQ